MFNLDHHLKSYLREQIALEEQLCREIEEQIAEINEKDFADAKDLLIQTRQALECHFKPLNETLDRLERAALNAQTKIASENGNGLIPALEREQQIKSIARILRDDYSALNHITMSNTLLYTTALALNCQEVAEIALKHLENLAPLVVKLGAIAPEVVARELRTKSPQIDLTVAQKALINARLVWRKAG